MRTIIKRSAVACLFSIVAVFSFPTMAFAESGSSGGASGLSLLFPTLGEWIPMLIGFIVLWIILAKFGWPMFIGMIDKRKQTIKDSLEKAENARIENQRILDEQKANLDEARQQGAQIVADAKKAAEMARADIEAKAAEEAESMLNRARLTIETEKRAAIAELQATVADLSISVVDRVIGENLTDADHRAIIERYVAEAGSFNDN
ncbi:MAG: F0F1 ATP synthase subunit B [Coriobacteriia bacterium]|nr:F0F1 ATP synthase subunit B [Coriobacteriia bacterium]